MEYSGKMEITLLDNGFVEKIVHNGCTVMLDGVPRDTVKYMVLSYAEEVGKLEVVVGDAVRCSLYPGAVLNQWALRNLSETVVYMHTYYTHRQGREV